MEDRVIEGACKGRPAKLSFSADAVALAGSGEEPVRVALVEGVTVTLVERGASGAVAVAGVVLLALAGLWAHDGVMSPPTWIASGAVGAVLLLFSRLARVSIVAVRSPEASFDFVCARGSRRAAREAVEELRESRPGSVRNPKKSVVGFILAEAGALGAGEGARRREYRLIAGEKADPEMEERFVAMRPRIAAWNLLWTMVLPTAGAAVAAALGSARGTTVSVIAGMIAFVVLVFAGLKLLPRLEPTLAKLLR